MLKKVFISIVVLLAVAYLAVAMTTFNRAPADAVCGGVEFRFDTIGQQDAGFITQEGLKRLLQAHKLYPQGKKMDSIRCRDMEACLEKSPFIRSAECYKTSSGRVCVEVMPRVPVLRVMADNGEQFYLDTTDEIIPGAGYVVHLPVVTGTVTRETASRLLHDLSLCIQQDAFWADQIEQIHVTPSGELEMAPRVGDHIIFLGKPKNVADKLERLKTFYKKALNKVGWNKYSRISLEFNNQIICTKK